jgi:outer membrane protein assembly factor BamE (lipoprotein component of BamABCDE complex)
LTAGACRCDGPRGKDALGIAPAARQHKGNKGFEGMIRMTGRYRRTLLAGVMLAVAATAAACSPRIDQRGNKPDEEQVVQINPGVDDKNRVAELIGTPSTISTFDDRTWYYISKRTETTAFFDPDVTDQEVLAINFDESGVVQNMRVYGQEDGRTIAYVDRTTPTEGNELTLIQQLLGNLGRFNPEGDERAN